METGVKFGAYHSYKDWGLMLVRMYIPMPQPKTYKVSVPGADGTLDLSEVVGRTTYNDREGLEFEFDLMDESYSKWLTTYSQISNAIHGQKIQVIPDDDVGYFYICRLNVDSQKSNPVLSQIVITGTAAPYKYDVQTSIEDWLWDPFNFETGVIRELKDIQITADSKTVEILGSGLDVVPIFAVTTSNDLALSYDGKSYPLPVGNTRLPEVRVGGTTQTLVFTGTGTLSIDFRGRSL